MRGKRPLSDSQIAIYHPSGRSASTAALRPSLQRTSSRRRAPPLLSRAAACGLNPCSHAGHASNPPVRLLIAVRFRWITAVSHRPNTAEFQFYSLPIVPLGNYLHLVERQQKGSGWPSASPIVDRFGIIFCHCFHGCHYCGVNAKL